MRYTATRSGLVTWIHKCLLWTTLLLSPLNLRGAEKFQLRPNPPHGAIHRVEVQLDVTGELKLNADGKQVQRVPMAVAGRLLYDETLRAGQGTLRAVRYYRAAEATIRVGDQKTMPRLSGDRRLVVVHEPAGQKPVLLSPQRHLTREDLDLIDVPGNTALLESLLPDEAQQVGDQWEHERRAAEVLFGLEAVSSAKLHSKLVDVASNEAIVELTGTIHGAVGGVAADLDVRGEYRFDLRRKLITRAALSIKEDRSVGHAAPGFEVQARLRLTRKPQPRSEYLNDGIVAAVPPEIPAGQELLDFVSRAGSFRLLHDRRWQVMVDQTKVTILRFIDRGDLIAQCNISQLTDLPAGQHLQLEQFESDIQKSLGEQFGQFVESSQSENELGYRVLRVVVVGVVSKLPIQWTYYHISNDEGRRVSYVVTMEGKYVERFAVADLALASSLEFTDRSDGSQPGETSQRPRLDRRQLRR